MRYQAMMKQLLLLLSLRFLTFPRDEATQMKRKIPTQTTFESRNFLVLARPHEKHEKKKLSEFLRKKLLSFGRKLLFIFIRPGTFLLRQDREQERWITNEKGELLSFRWARLSVASQANLIGFMRVFESLFQSLNPCFNLSKFLAQSFSEIP